MTPSGGRGDRGRGSWFWTEKVWAALIAGTVALVGAVLTLLASRWQLSSKVDELTQT